MNEPEVGKGIRRPSLADRPLAFPMSRHLPASLFQLDLLGAAWAAVSGRACADGLLVLEEAVVEAQGVVECVHFVVVEDADPVA